MCTHIKARNPAAHLHVESNTDAQTLTTKVLNFQEKIHAHGFEQLHLEFKVLLLSKEYEGVPIPVCTEEHTELLSVYH